MTRFFLTRIAAPPDFCLFGDLDPEPSALTELPESLVSCPFFESCLSLPLPCHYVLHLMANLLPFKHPSLFLPPPAQILSFTHPFPLCSLLPLTLFPFPSSYCLSFFSIPFPFYNATTCILFPIHTLTYSPWILPSGFSNSVLADPCPPLPPLRCSWNWGNCLSPCPFLPSGPLTYWKAVGFLFC